MAFTFEELINLIDLPINGFALSTSQRLSIAPGPSLMPRIFLSGSPNSTSKFSILMLPWRSNHSVFYQKQKLIYRWSLLNFFDHRI